MKKAAFLSISLSRRLEMYMAEWIAEFFSFSNLLLCHWRVSLGCEWTKVVPHTLVLQETTGSFVFLTPSTAGPSKSQWVLSLEWHGQPLQSHRNLSTLQFGQRKCKKISKDLNNKAFSVTGKSVCCWLHCFVHNVCSTSYSNQTAGGGLIKIIKHMVFSHSCLSTKISVCIVSTKPNLFIQQAKCRAVNRATFCL